MSFLPKLAVQKGWKIPRGSLRKISQYFKKQISIKLRTRARKKRFLLYLLQEDLCRLWAFHAVDSSKQVQNSEGRGQSCRLHFRPENDRITILNSLDGRHWHRKKTAICLPYPKADQGPLHTVYVRKSWDVYKVSVLSLKRRSHRHLAWPSCY